MKTALKCAIVFCSVTVPGNAIQAKPAAVLPNVETDDPLRDLVLCSKNSDCEPMKLNALATKAANIETLNEAPKPSTTMKSLAGIFAGTETFVRKVEETIKKKYTALDPSDSEGFGGNSWLHAFLFLIIKNGLIFKRLHCLEKRHDLAERNRRI